MEHMQNWETVCFNLVMAQLFIIYFASAAVAVDSSHMTGSISLVNSIDLSRKTVSWKKVITTAAA